MEPNSVRYAVALLELIVKVADTGTEVFGMATKALELLQRQGAPTAAEWEALNAKTKALEDRILNG
jgi:hypothetical protein